MCIYNIYICIWFAHRNRQAERKKKRNIPTRAVCWSNYQADPRVAQQWDTVTCWGLLRGSGPNQIPTFAPIGVHSISFALSHGLHLGHSVCLLHLHLLESLYFIPFLVLFHGAVGKWAKVQQESCTMGNISNPKGTGCCSLRWACMCWWAAACWFATTSSSTIHHESSGLAFAANDTVKKMAGIRTSN